MVNGLLTQVRALRIIRITALCRQDLTLRNLDLDPIFNLQAQPSTNINLS
jgi:hypothetical protein